MRVIHGLKLTSALIVLSFTLLRGILPVFIPQGKGFLFTLIALVLSLTVSCTDISNIAHLKLDFPPEKWFSLMSSLSQKMAPPFTLFLNKNLGETSLILPCLWLYLQIHIWVLWILSPPIRLNPFISFCDSQCLSPEAQMAMIVIPWWFAGPLLSTFNPQSTQGNNLAPDSSHFNLLCSPSHQPTPSCKRFVQLFPPSEPLHMPFSLLEMFSLPPFHKTVLSLIKFLVHSAYHIFDMCACLLPLHFGFLCVPPSECEFTRWGWCHPSSPFYLSP